MYKRPARVRFVARSGERVRMAASCLARLGQGWAEPAAAGPLPPPCPPEGGAAPEPGPDLVIILDSSREPPGPGAPRTLHWPLPDDSEAARTELERRVAGMIGGMRMLARLDAKE